MTVAPPFPGRSSEYRAFNARLSRRITQVAVSVTLSLAFVAGALAYLLTRSLVQDNITDALERQVELVSQQLELNLGAVSRELSGLAATTVVSNALLDDSGRNVYLLPLLNAFKLPYDIEFSLMVSDFEGKPVASRYEAGGAGYQGVSWVNNVIEEGVAIAEIVAADHERQLILAYPVLFPATGQAEGMLVLDFPLNQMLKDEPSFHNGGTAITMTCKNGCALNAPVEQTGEKLVTAKRVLSLPPPMDSLGLEISVGKSREALYSPLRQLTMVFALVVALVVAIVIFVARFMARRITAPLAALSASAQNIALSGRPTGQVCIEGEDEVAALAHSFNNMVARLQIAQDELEQRVEERTRDLQKARQAAESANNAKSEFLANMSHEFRTPMHAILSFASLAIDKLETAPTEKTQHYLERIHESGNRLLCLLNDLLDLSKLEAGKMEFSMAQHDMQQVSEIVKQEVMGLLKKNGVILNIEHGEELALAWFDQDRMMQVMRNLFTNAIKFTPYGNSITVTFCATELAPESGGQIQPGLKVAVSDQGIGIPDEELPMIFDKFVQSSKTKTGAGGTGLGLAICKEIIEGHGGKIWASKNPEGGAVFSFVIPVGPELVEGDRD